MKFTKIYWDQLRSDDVFRVRNYDGTVSEECLATSALPRKWEVHYEEWLEPGVTKKKCFLDMNGFCERLQ